MQTIVNLPDPLYQKSEALAASRGSTMEQFIVEAVKKEVQGNLGSGASGSFGDREVYLPVIRSTRPGTLDLSHLRVRQGHDSQKSVSDLSAVT